jgi:Methyltransferase domain
VLKTFVKKTLSEKFGLAVFRIGDRHSQDGLFTIHSDHVRGDPGFRAAYSRGLQASQGIDPKFEWRLHIALGVARAAVRVAGDFAECGVNTGFMSSAIMHQLGWNAIGKRFYLIDTFNGPVLSQYSTQETQNGRVDIAKRALRAGAYVTDVDRIRANFAEWPNAIVVQGAVPEVLDSVNIGPVAFLHIDMNCALPEQRALAYFWERLSPGAVVLLDDYAYAGHEYQRDTIDAFARLKGIEVLSLPTGQGIIIN